MFITVTAERNVVGVGIYPNYSYTRQRKERRGRELN
jgi:hypothetical protein